MMEVIGGAWRCMMEVHGTWRCMEVQVHGGAWTRYMEVHGVNEGAYAGA